MTSFSCPNLEMADDFCARLRTDCVPGRPGCVLEHNSVFAVPAEERIRAKQEERLQREQERQDADACIVKKKIRSTPF
jgi:hypothetical protein